MCWLQIETHQGEAPRGRLYSALCTYLGGRGCTHTFWVFLEKAGIWDTVPCVQRSEISEGGNPCPLWLPSFRLNIFKSSFPLWTLCSVQRSWMIDKRLSLISNGGRLNWRRLSPPTVSLSLRRHGLCIMVVGTLRDRPWGPNFAWDNSSRIEMGLPSNFVDWDLHHLFSVGSQAASTVQIPDAADIIMRQIQRAGSPGRRTALLKMGGKGWGN